jgi:hypothetical protein
VFPSKPVDLVELRTAFERAVQKVRCAGAAAGLPPRCAVLGDALQAPAAVLQRA